jgi:hypothetical protein
VRNMLTLIEDGPRLVRSFTVEHWGISKSDPCFEINDNQDISCLDAIKCFGFEECVAGLVEMLKCNCSLNAEYKELLTRIEKADSLLAIQGEKFRVECRAT